MISVLIVQNRIAEYRVPIFNRLAEIYKLTVCYSDGDMPNGINFQVIHNKNNRGKLWWRYEKSMRKTMKDFDVTIIPMDTRQIDYHFALLFKNTAVIVWGIGVSASYNVKFDSKQRSKTLLARDFYKLADASLFYSQYPIDKLKNHAYPTERYFVANNTVEVMKTKIQTEKNSILFIGTLYPQKRIHELLSAYYEAFKVESSIPELVIIGDGTEKESILSFVNEHNIESKVKVTGEIFDENKLSEYYSCALACISPNQAGLSVLKSMGYGVPYITYRDAITGGERLNISHMTNGVLFDDFSQIKEIILDIHQNRQKYIDMGVSAYKYYWKYRTPEIMVKGFVNAIEYVYRKRYKRDGAVEK